MTTHINDSGTWREPVQVQVNDGGVWRTIQDIKVNDGGTWRTVFQYALYNGTITEGSDGLEERGFSSGFWGSASPTTLTDGKTLFQVSNNISATLDGFLAVTGFSSDPGSTYCSSVTVGGVQKFTASASYFYDSGAGMASWTWAGSSFGLDGLGTSTVLIVP